MNLCAAQPFAGPPKNLAKQSALATGAGGLFGKSRHLRFNRRGQIESEKMALLKKLNLARMIDRPLTYLLHILT